jgi:hypothetical protein
MDSPFLRETSCVLDFAKKFIINFHIKDAKEMETYLFGNVGIRMCQNHTWLAQFCNINLFQLLKVLNYSSSNDRFTIYLGKMTDEILHLKSRLIFKVDSSENMVENEIDASQCKTFFNFVLPN